MQTWRLDSAAIERLYRQARADRWQVGPDEFAVALERSVRKAFAHEPDARELARYCDALHLEDLALACACAAGHEAAWEHFVREYRPALYRAADAIDPSGGSRDLADSIYGELFGLKERGGQRRSHFEYFHGRSSLGTWLRAVLSQRHVDRVRGTRRFEPLPSDEAPDAPALVSAPQNRAPSKYVALMHRVFASVVAALAPKDRLRLACYYAQDLTLAQIGRALGEHEATVSRNLTRVRREIRLEVERRLRDQEGMGEAEVSECFDSVVDDPGSLDVADLLGSGAEGQNPQESARSDGARKDGRDKRSKGRTEGASA